MDFAGVDSQTLMDKVRKLMALADSKSSTEAEAALAAAKVQELVQSYGLDLAQLGDTAVSEVRGMGTVDRRAMFDYQQALMATIAKNNFCFHDVRVVYVERKNRNSKQHFLVGRQLNIQVTVNLYDYLIGTMKRLCEEHGYKDHSTRNLFYDGVTERLCTRLNDQRAFREAEELKRQSEARAAGTGGTALVLADVYGSEADLNNDAINGFPYGTTAARRAKREADEAARMQRQKQFIAEGHDNVVAFYLSHNYPLDRAKLLAANYEVKVVKEARRTRTRRSSHTGFTRHDRKLWERQASPAYRAGKKVGDSIGIDTQIEKAEGLKQLK